MIQLSSLKKPSFPSAAERQKLSADPQFRDDGTVTLDICAIKIIKQPATLADHFIHAQSAVIILWMFLQMVGELTDPLGKDRHLNFRRAGIGFMSTIVFNDSGLLLFGDHFLFPFCDSFRLAQFRHTAQNRAQRSKACIF